MTTYPRLAKISRPSVQGALERKRLFLLLDAYLDRSVVWLTAPAGSGKTTLAGGYLENRNISHIWYQMDEDDSDIATFFYYMGLAADHSGSTTNAHLPVLAPEYLSNIYKFTRRYFENLYGRLTPPFVIVLDNYQEVPEQSAFHALLKIGLSCIPKGISVMLISRNDPPPQLVRLKAQRRLKIIGWDEIRFTLDETRRLLSGSEKPNLSEDLSEDTIKLLFDKTQGWAAGIVLLWDRLKKLGERRIPSTALPMNEVFQYFGEEIFSGIEEWEKHFLLKTSFLPRMTSRMAQVMTGRKNADQILTTMSRGFFFMASHPVPQPVYIYHPMFRDFLLQIAHRTYSDTALAGIKKQAANLLEKMKMIEEAAKLYLDIQDTDEVERFISEQAPLLLRQGRNKTVEKWVRKVPKEILETRPVLYYWLGMSCQPFAPSNAREYFERAFQLSGSRRFTLRMLCWSAVIDSFLYEWNDFTPLDTWIEWLDENVDPDLSSLPPEIKPRIVSSIVAALMIRRPDHPKLDHWQNLALNLARDHIDPEVRFQAYIHLVTYHFWVGNVKRGRLILEEIRLLAQADRASPLTRLTWNWLEASVEIWGGSYETAHDKIINAMVYAKEYGIHLWDHMILAQGAYCCLMQRHPSEAEKSFLKPMAKQIDSSRRHMLSHYFYLTAWKEYLNHEIELAYIHARIALRHARKTGYIFPEILCRLALVWICHHQGRLSDAKGFLDSAVSLSEWSGNRFTRYVCLLARSQFEFDSGQERMGLETLETALQIGGKEGYTGFTWWCEPPFLSRLCARALENNIEVTFVKDLIRKRSLLFEGPPPYPAHWPWPVKIYVLGRFNVFRKGESIHFSRKVQKKPLDLLKMLIAYGGKQVHTDAIADALWPEAEGDVAQKSFATTLHRLRLLIGEKKSLRLQDKRLTLDDRYCWVDALAFDNAVDALEMTISEARSDELIARYEMLIDLYRGHFLETELEKVWAVQFRERLKEKMIRVVTFLGRFLEEKGEWRSAVRYYEQGLKMDPLAEIFYQRLMHCYITLGRPAESVKLYNRCRKILSSELGVGPSDETRKIHLNLLSR